MTQDNTLNALLKGLLAEDGGEHPRLPLSFPERRKLLRALMNKRPPRPISPALLALQNEILQEELARKPVIAADTLPPAALDSRLSLWQGDITALRCRAIVNAGNSDLLGCFHPLHSCIDNVIHSAAGIQLRLACHALMEAQGHPEHPGGAKLTPGYNLPAAYVLHTVGPVALGGVTAEHRATLASCYRSCLTLAEEHRLESVAFCCISTGLYGFPQAPAGRIAVDTVRAALPHCPHIRKVVFNVFTDEDYAIYHDLLF